MWRFADCKRTLNIRGRSEAVVLCYSYFVICADLWFVLRGVLSCWVLPCFLFSCCCFSSPVWHCDDHAGERESYRSCFSCICLFIFCALYLNRLMTKQQSDCAPREDADQPGHPPSLIRVFAVRMKKHWVLSYPLSAQRRLWSDWADVQVDLNLCWAHFVGFVMSWLILYFFRRLCVMG